MPQSSITVCLHICGGVINIETHVCAGSDREKNNIFNIDVFSSKDFQMPRMVETFIVHNTIFIELEECLTFPVPRIVALKDLKKRRPKQTPEQHGRMNAPGNHTTRGLEHVYYPAFIAPILTRRGTVLCSNSQQMNACDSSSSFLALISTSYGGFIMQSRNFYPVRALVVLVSSSR